MTLVERVRHVFYDRRVIFNNEKELQDEIAQMLDSERIQYAREFRVGRNVLDFLLVASRTALEIARREKYGNRNFGLASSYRER